MCWLKLVFPLVGLSFCARIPEIWSEFLENMTGSEIDRRALLGIFDSHLVEPAVAVLDILRSKKCSDGIHDCSRLIKACNLRGGYLKEQCSINDLECYFKYFVSHRDRGICPDSVSRRNKTLYNFAYSFDSNSGLTIHDIHKFRLAVKHETSLPTEDDMIRFFELSGDPQLKLKALSILLDSGKPIYRCMFIFALHHKACLNAQHNHPRIVAYEPAGSNGLNWYKLAHNILGCENPHRAISFASKCLAMGAQVKLECTTIFLDSEEAFSCPPGLDVKLYGLLCAYTRDNPAQFQEGITPLNILLIYGIAYWTHFKLLLAILEQEEEATRNTLKNVFFRGTDVFPLLAITSD